MNHQLYPSDWPALAREIKHICGYTCQACGVQCRRPGEFWLGWHYELTVAHISQDYDGEVVQLAALCLPCHLRYDAAHSFIARQRRRRLRQRQAGQLTLLSVTR